MESDAKYHTMSIQSSVIVPPTPDPGLSGSGQRNSKNGTFIGGTMVHAQPQASSMHSGAHQTDVPAFISGASPHEAPVLVPPISESRVSIDARARGRSVTIGGLAARGDGRFERSFSARNSDGEIAGEGVQGDTDGVAEAARLKQMSLKSLRRTIRSACPVSVACDCLLTARSVCHGSPAAAHEAAQTT
jgi:hypothetical protein